jgi:hypothetical protein
MGVSVVEPQKQEGEEGQSTGQAADIENHIAENLDIITTSNKQENLEQ